MTQTSTNDSYTHPSVANPLWWFCAASTTTRLTPRRTFLPIFHKKQNRRRLTIKKRRFRPHTNPVRISPWPRANLWWFPSDVCVACSCLLSSTTSTSGSENRLWALSRLRRGVFSAFSPGLCLGILFSGGWQQVAKFVVVNMVVKKGQIIVNFD